MAVVWVHKVNDQRERSEAERTAATNTYIYQVLTDSMDDTTLTARTANDGTTAIPQPGEVIDGLIVSRVEAERMNESPFTFIVTVTATFSLATGGGTRWETTITVDGDSYTEPVFQDTNGKPIQNSCKQSFDPPIEKTYYDQEEISVGFKSNTVDVSTISACRGKLNDSTITLHIAGLGYSRSFAAKTLKLLKATYGVTIANDGTPLYWNINYVLGYRADTWARKVVDRGLYVLDTDGVSLVPIYDREGNPVTTPQFLDGSGQKLAAGANAFEITFDIDETASFTSLFTGL